MRGQFEYRVKWQRHNQRPKMKVYQTKDGAENCAKIQLGAAEEIDWLDDPVPPLVAGPTIESRIVGQWKEMPCA